MQEVIKTSCIKSLFMVKYKKRIMSKGGGGDRINKQAGKNCGNCPTQWPDYGGKHRRTP